MIIYTFFFLPLDPGGCGEPLKVQVATCPGPGAPGTCRCVRAGVQVYTHLVA